MFASKAKFRQCAKLLLKNFTRHRVVDADVAKGRAVKVAVVKAAAKASVVAKP